MSPQRRGRMGWAGYADLLRRLVDCPSTAPDLADQFCMSADSMSQILRQMRALKLVHIGALAPNARGFKAVRLWHFGDGPHVGTERAATKQPRVELVATAVMLRALTRAPHSALTLGELAGVGRTRASTFLRHLNAIRLVYVARWGGGLVRAHTPTAFFMFGIDRNDVPRPAPMPKGEYDRRYRHRKARERDQRDNLRRLGAINSPFFQQVA